MNFADTLLRPAYWYSGDYADYNNNDDNKNFGSSEIISTSNNSIDIKFILTDEELNILKSFINNACIKT